jgi:hypothetical protein
MKSSYIVQGHKGLFQSESLFSEAEVGLLAKHFQKLCNFKAELLCCEVHKAELRFVKQSSPKQALTPALNCLQNNFSRTLQNNPQSLQNNPKILTNFTIIRIIIIATVWFVPTRKSQVLNPSTFHP